MVCSRAKVCGWQGGIVRQDVRAPSRVDVSDVYDLSSVPADGKGVICLRR